MSEYNYKFFAKEFARRANENYNNLYNQYKTNPHSCGVYEINALITAMYGIVVLPSEAFKHKLYTIDFEFEKRIEIESNGAYKKLREIIESLYKQIRIRSTYCDESAKMSPLRFIYHLRNALSHSGDNGMNFIPVTKSDTQTFQDSRDITHIYFHDQYTKDKKILFEFCTIITVEELKIVKDCVIEIMSCDSFYNDVGRKHYDPIDKYDKFLANK